jgi:predicted O-methyltransferase YrrM
MHSQLFTLNSKLQMHSPFQLAFKYLNYFFTASNGKGHGIHSPFVFEFVTKVLNGAKDENIYTSIESIRKKLLHDNTSITVEDFGAGSRIIGTKKRIVKKIASTSLKPKKYSQLLHRMVKHYQPKTILEIGTSLGITTSYLAKAGDNASVITMEGANAIASIAKQNFESLGISNIQQVIGNFDDTLPATLSSLPTIDLAFIDGNHRYEPTINYFRQILDKSNNDSIIILDDIYWSSEMEQAWNWVKQHEQVRLTIDLFAIGIVVLRKEVLHQQHFRIRY